MVKESILIIAYKSCPRGGVGTRRWSKFAKYLSKDYRVHLLTAKYFKKDTINWCKDILDNENIAIHRTNSYYPEKWAGQSNGPLFQKFMHHVFRNTLFYFDYSQHWHRTYLEKATELIATFAIKQVIITGPPFAFIARSIQLKELFPTIQLLIDYRDPWNFVAPLGHYGRFFRGSRRKKAIEQETKVIAKADSLFFVSKNFTSAYKERFPKFQHKFKVLYNGFDPLDYPKEIINPSNKAEILRLIYGGNLFGVRGRKEMLVLILQAIHELKDDFFITHFKIDVYTNNTPAKSISKLKSVQHLYEQIVQIKPAISSSAYLAQLQTYPVCLSLNGQNQFFAIPTKVFDYFALNKAIFNIGPAGELHQLLTTYRQYTTLPGIAAIKKVLVRLKNDFLKQQLQGYKIDHIQQFSIPNLTNQLTQCFK